MTGRRRLWLALGIGAAIVIAAIAAWILWPQSGPFGAAPGADPVADDTPPAAPPVAKSESPPEETAELPEAVQRYLAANVYPPTSGQLGGAAVDLLEPNRRYEDFKIIPGTQGTDPELRFLWTTDQFQYKTDEVVRARFEARAGDRSTRVAGLEAVARPEGRSGAVGDPIPLRFRPSGDALVADLDLSREMPDHHGPVVLVAAYRVPGAPAREESIRIFVTPVSAIPARFTGTFRDANDGGSLVVEVGLEVDEPGFYRLDANLYDATDMPVAWATFKGDLSREDGFAPLRFFGKVLHDTGGAGPYVMRELRGYLFQDGGFPDRLHMRDYEGTYRTGAWSLADFSDAEWESEHKARMVELLLEDQRRGITLDVPPEAAPDPAAGGDAGGGAAPIAPGP